MCFGCSCFFENFYFIFNVYFSLELLVFSLLSAKSTLYILGDNPLTLHVANLSSQIMERIFTFDVFYVEKFLCFEAKLYFMACAF
jgi:hypothetical protein